MSEAYDTLRALGTALLALKATIDDIPEDWRPDFEEALQTLMDARDDWDNALYNDGREAALKAELDAFTKAEAERIKALRTAGDNHD